MSHVSLHKKNPFLFLLPKEKTESSSLSLSSWITEVQGRSDISTKKTKPWHRLSRKKLGTVGRSTPPKHICLYIYTCI
jgi:hypothetical protein